MNLIERLLFRIGSNRVRIAIARRWGAKIGENCMIHGCSLGSEPYLINIGNHVGISDGVTFITHDGATWVFRGRKDFEETKYGPIVIRDNCVIGMNAVILPNVEMGPNTVVNAGAVVTRSLNPNSVYAGNPARFVYTYEEYLEICRAKSTGRIPVDEKEKKRALLKMFEDKLK